VVTYGQIHQRIVEELAPPSVLVDEQYEIVHVSERAGRYLRFVGGEPSRNILKVIDPALLLYLRGLLLEVKGLEPNDPGAAAARRVQFEYEGEKSIVTLTVRRVGHSDAAPGYLLVVFDELNAKGEIDASKPESASQAGLQIVEQLDAELRQTRDRLQLSIEQYETSAEELKASKEELQAINEELHSTAQELEASEQVLQSVSQELVTVNQELSERIEEHSLTNNDLQTLIDSTDIVTIFLDRDLHIKRYTPQVQELFNIMPTDIGRPLDHFTHKLNYDFFAQDAENVLRTMQNSEREVRSSDGRWYRARLLDCRTLENDIDGVVIDFVDVTERKNAEERGREVAELRQHSRIMTLAPVLIRDMDSRITLWSADCERLFGFTSAEAIGRDADDLLSTQLPAPLELIHRELFSTGSWQGELIRTTSSGELVTVASRWIVYHNEGGDPAAILEANHDIGVRKRAEVELRETNRQKDEFLATLSHELRNPLSAILNGMQLLQGADEKEVVRSVHGVMKRQFSHLLCLVDDLLDLERLRYGKIILRKERINLAALIESALETAHAVVKAHSHELTVSIDPQPLYVCGDSIRLAQVIVNLLHNAARYTLPGGAISITLASQGPDALISVRDNGMGTKAETLPHIFDLYVQAEPSSDSGRRGLGVGLSLAQKLVQLHDGRIEATSGGLGLGSKFDVYMPLIPPDRRDIVLDLNRQNGTAASGSSRRVLIIDDDPDVADSLATLFTMSNHHAWTAYTGLRGIEAALEHLPDVVLIDIVMPDMDGYEVGRHLRERLPDALLIAVSGLAQESDQARSREAGFDHYMTKPVTFRELEQLIDPLH